MWLGSLEKGEIFFACSQRAFGDLQVSMAMAWYVGEHAAAFVSEPAIDIMGRALRCKEARTASGISWGIDHRVTAALVPLLADEVVVSKIWLRVAVGVHAILRLSSCHNVQKVVRAVLSLRQMSSRWCHVVDSSLEGMVVRTTLFQFQ
jgi:hypothetical protein